MLARCCHLEQRRLRCLGRLEEELRTSRSEAGIEKVVDIHCTQPTAVNQSGLAEAMLEWIKLVIIV